MKMSHRQRIVLIAAGGAAGIAATFNAPIGGLTFAMELLLISLSAINVALVVIATVTATVISRAFLGMDPSFFVPDLSLSLHQVLNPEVLVLFVPFSILMGAAAALFIHCIYWFEDSFDAVIKNPYIRHMTGMFFLGLMLYILMRYSGHYYVDGVGYSTILDILRGVLSNPWMLLLLFFCKLIATSLTLGSGASGGVFSPSLFLGACLGAAFAIIAQHLFPELHIRASLFAVAGMAAMVGGSTGAVVTAVVMTFEQTRDYADILPIMLSVALTYAVRVKITSESIYTLKLLRRGKMIPQGLEAAISSNKRARHLMNTDFKIILEDELNSWLADQKQDDFPRCTIVSKDNKVTGVVRQELGYLRADMDAQKLIDPNYVIISANTTWPAILRTMYAEKATVVLVSKTIRSQNPDDIVGVITQRELVASSHETAQLLD
jgi:CIC family chloride channel protein